jgi:ribosomal protein S18 acetylase RimI-like enzyme
VRDGVRQAGAADRATVVELVFAGFKDDPSTRWSLPADDYEGRLRRSIEFDVGDALEAGEVWLTAGDESVAWWSPAATREERRQEVEEYFRDDAETYGDRLGAVTAAELAIIDELPSKGEFRYLEALATRAASRRRGHATAVLAPGLERAAAEGVAAILDADNPEVLAFYKSAGFRHLAQVEVADAPTAWVMVREPPSSGTFGTI